MQHWYKKGYLKPSLKVKSVPRGQDDSPRHSHTWIEISALPYPKFTTEVPLVAKSSKAHFFYKDEHGEVRGPYKFSHISHWARRGYLDDKLLIKASETGPYVRFSVLKIHFMKRDPAGAKAAYDNAIEREQKLQQMKAKDAEESRQYQLENQKHEERLRLKEEQLRKQRELKRKERERLKRECAEQERLQREAEKRQASERAEAERLAKEKAERERVGRRGR